MINVSSSLIETDVRALNDAERAVGRRLRDLVKVHCTGGLRLAAVSTEAISKAFAEEGLDPDDYAMCADEEGAIGQASRYQQALTFIIASAV